MINPIPCWVYKSNRIADTYVYLDREENFSALPAELATRLGPLQLVMTIELTPERTLARAEPRAVIEALASRGFYLQLPPSKDAIG